MAKPLADLNRCALSPQVAALAGSNPDYAASLVAAASRAIQEYCHADISLNSYSVYLDGESNGEQAILLPQRPVVGVSRVAADPRPVLSVVNGGATAQRATVATTATGLVLTSVASGVPTTATVNYTSAPTLSALATAVGATAGGWSAKAQVGYELFPSADLRPLQGALNALATGAQLEMYLEDLQPYGGGYGTGVYGGMGGYGWRLDASAGILWATLPRGRRSVRCDFVAGFDPVPEPVQEAVALLTAFYINAANFDMATLSMRLGDFGISSATRLPKIPEHVMEMIGPFVLHDKLTSAYL